MAHLGKHYRAELIITAWDEEFQLSDAPIVVRGFIPLSFEEGIDRTDPHFRAEITKLAVEGLADFADRQPEDPTEESTTNSNKKETV